MAGPDLKEIHDFLIRVAHKAGDMITSAIPQEGGPGSKKNSADLVTETDKAVEDMVSSTLRQQYPDYKFMGEETYQPGDKLTNAPTFIVDPIDGTTNFVHGYPYVSISLGLAVNTEPVVGIVYNPFTDVLYSGIKGRGSFKQQKTRLPLKGDSVEKLDCLNKALVIIEWGSDRAGSDFDTKVETFKTICRAPEPSKGLKGGMVRALRSFGSAALNLCAIAEGGVDIYWESGCWAWDVCAGWVILKEAGGMIVDGNPGNWNPNVDDRRYLALRNGATKEVVEEFWSCIQGSVSYKA